MIIQNKTSLRIPLRKLQYFLKRILKALPASRVDFDVTFVTEGAIRRLNRKWRKKDRPTDVLSFPLYEPGRARRGGVFLGDIVISLSVARCQAKEHEKSLVDEILFLATHGALHLLGYDHEKSQSQALLMKRWERKILQKVGKVKR